MDKTMLWEDITEKWLTTSRDKQSPLSVSEHLCQSSLNPSYLLTLQLMCCIQKLNSKPSNFVLSCFVLFVFLALFFLSFFILLHLFCFPCSFHFSPCAGMGWMASLWRTVWAARVKRFELGDGSGWLLFKKNLVWKFGFLCWALVCNVGCGCGVG